eukprot:TRINITY_DN21440_c0_g1_i1.p1 TRINITY_DN21440_c0_g1~~TRINITY_DN21440_c0_g1_i1.p1  ORF type:complete len:314 (-),score=83.09 TRINITY_DN21440_c0_g1_i1:217-1158(-)
MLHRRLLVATALLGLACCEEHSEEADQAYLTANAEQDGVVTLGSGVQYRVLKAHREGAKGPPQVDFNVACHFEARLVNGTVFDSSYKRNKPQEFTPSQVVKGWQEVLLQMFVGDEWEVSIPAELGYGAKGLGKIVPPNAVIIMKLHLLEVSDAEEWGDWIHKVVFHVGPIPVSRFMIIPMFIAMAFHYLKSLFGGPKTWARARHICTKTEPECYKALSRVNKGEDFEKVAEELSTCRSKSSGGSLGKFGRDIMAPEFDKVVFDTQKTEVGKVYGPIKTQFGYHILIVDERTISEEEEFEAYKKAQEEEKKKKR